MANILFINLPVNGHVNPSLGLVGELTKQGHRVSYMLTESYRAKVEAAGGVLLPYCVDFDLDTLTLNLGNINTIRKIFDLFKSVYSLAQNEIPKFDFVIYDSIFFAGETLTKQAGKPSACSVTTFAVNDKIVAQVLQSKGFVYTLLRNRFVRRCITGLLNNTILKVVNIRVRDIFDVFKSPTSGLKIVYTSRYFQPHSEDFDDTFLFIGPSIFERKQDTAFPYEKLRGRIIYISLGTVANKAMWFYKQCFEAFANTEATVVMSVGKRMDLPMLGSIPDNFLVFDHVPQIEVLQCAELFITHGGMNSVSEGLYYGVPLIIIPQTLDQPLVADRVCELGAGIQLHKKDVSAASLKDAVQRILEDESYRTKSKEIKASYFDAGGFEKAVKEIALLTKPE